jgi:Ca2+-binding EF-hand superfamily protein
MAEDVGEKEEYVFTATDLEVLQEVFNAFDKDSGGSIDTDELGAAMKALGAESSRAELEKLVEEIDEDGNGEIDFDEFCAMIRQKMSGTSVDELHTAFAVFNKSGNGFLEAGAYTSFFSLHVHAPAPPPPPLPCFPTCAHIFEAATQAPQRRTTAR